MFKKVIVTILILVVIFSSIFCVYTVRQRYVDYDYDFLTVSGTQDIQPSGSDNKMFSYEAMPAIEFDISKDMAFEICQAVFLSTTRYNYDKLGKSLLNYDIANGFRYKIKGEYDADIDEYVYSMKVTPKSKLSPDFMPMAVYAVVLRDLAPLEILEIKISGEDGRVISLKANGGDTELIIDERCAVDIAAVLLKRKSTINLSGEYDKADVASKWEQKDYLKYTHAIVANCYGKAYYGEDDAEYFRVGRDSRLLSDIKDEYVNTYQYLSVLIRKSDGKIMKLWQTDGI